MVYKYLDKKTSGGTVKSENTSNKESVEELYKLINRKFNKRKVHRPFIDNIKCADLADMQFLREFNKGFRFLLCLIDIYSKYEWVIRLKDKKGATIANAFQKILDETNREPNKIWEDKSSIFYNRSMKLLVEKNAVEMYSTHNEGKSVVAETFITTLKYKTYKYMNSISKNVYINKLDDIVNQYNNTRHH